MQGSKQQDVISNNKEGFSSKIAQKIIEITERMPDGGYICMRINSHSKYIVIRVRGGSWFFYTNSNDFKHHSSDWNRIADDHYKKEGAHVLFVQLEDIESTFLQEYIKYCAKQANESVLSKNGIDDCGDPVSNPASEPTKRFTSKEMLKDYFRYFDVEYKKYITGGVNSHGKLANKKRENIKILKEQVTFFRNFIEAVGGIVDKIEGQFTINLAFDYVKTGNADKDKMPYIKLKHGKNIQFIVVTDYINDYVKSLLRRWYIECNLCIPDSHYECRKEDEYIQFHYYKFEGNSDELDLARKYILGNTPLYSRHTNTGEYQGNKTALLEYFYNSTQQFCQDNQKESVGTLVSERNDLIRKNQTKAIDNFIEQIESIILEHIPDDTTLNIAIDISTQITSGNKTWIIANDSEYSHFHGYRSHDNNYNLAKSELTISDPVYQLIKAKGLTSKKLKGRAETCKYLSELSQELNQYMYNELADCNKISTTGINYNNNTQAAYIGLGLSSTLTTTLLPLYNYTVGDKSIDAKNLPRICAATNASALQQNTTDILGYDSSEDNDNNIIIAMLVSVFAAFAIVGVLIAYCKSHHQRRNSNRDPSVSFIRNRRELEDLERGDEPLQSEERERLSVQGEDAQQLDSDNEASGPSAHSNTSSHTSSSTSSRSGTASQAGSSVSIEEDGRSGASSEESGSDNSQRSSSPANVPQKPPRTLVQNVEEAEISNNQVSNCYC